MDLNPKTLNPAHLGSLLYLRQRRMVSLSRLSDTCLTWMIRPGPLAKANSANKIQKACNARHLQLYRDTSPRQKAINPRGYSLMQKLQELSILVPRGLPGITIPTPYSTY